MTTLVKESSSIDSGGGAAGWGMGAGLLFLVLFILIIFGFAWSRDSHRDGRDHIREHFDRMGSDSNYQRGDIREILTNAIRSNERINDVWQGTREILANGFQTQRQVELGLERVQCAVGDGARLAANSSRFEADRILERGLTFGFRTFDIVRPDPCRDVCSDRNRFGGFGRNGIIDLNTGTQVGNALGSTQNSLAAGAVQGPIG